MADSTHEVTRYRPDHREGVLALLTHLWGGDVERNSSYFEWKYEKNPHADTVLGIVASVGGEVVGFRGYFAARLRVGDRAHTVLRPGDTCVDPGRRRGGLSVAMGRLAMDELASSYQLFINFSCTKPSLPGYLRMGFHALAPKVHLTRCSVAGLARYVAARSHRPTGPGRIALGRSGNIVVSAGADPTAMAALAAADTGRDDRIRLAQDREFFSWRYSSPAHTYRFYLSTGEGGPRAYVVIGMSANQRRGYIVDHAETGVDGFAEILEHVISSRHFDVLSILRLAVDDRIAATLRRLGFRDWTTVRAIEKVIHGELPVLIRPVARRFSEEDFMLDGLDTRDPESWALHAIASDAV